MESPHVHRIHLAIYIVKCARIHTHTHNEDIFGVELNTKIIFETRWYKKNVFKNSLRIHLKKKIIFFFVFLSFKSPNSSSHGTSIVYYVHVSLHNKLGEIRWIINSNAGDASAGRMVCTLHLKVLIFSFFTFPRTYTRAFIRSQKDSLDCTTFFARNGRGKWKKKNERAIYCTPTIFPINKSTKYYLYIIHTSANHYYDYSVIYFLFAAINEYDTRVKSNVDSDKYQNWMNAFSFGI